jgi:hypothetical protein
MALCACAANERAGQKRTASLNASVLPVMSLSR